MNDKATAKEVIEAFERPSQGYQIAMLVEKIWPDLKRAIVAYGKAGHDFKIRRVTID